MPRLNPVGAQETIAVNFMAGSDISLTDRVVQVVQDTFEKLKQTVVLFWKALVSWTQKSWTASMFVFFRVMDYVHPTLASNVERGYLYATNFVHHYYAQAMEADLRARNAILVVQKEEAETLALRLATERNALRDRVSDLENKDELTQLKLRHSTENYSRLDEKYLQMKAERNQLRKDLEVQKQNNGLNQDLVELAAKKAANVEKQIAAISAERDLWKAKSEEHAPKDHSPSAGSDEATRTKTADLETIMQEILSADKNALFLDALHALQQPQTSK